jgi:hypothetical protein
MNKPSTTIPVSYQALVQRFISSPGKTYLVHGDAAVFQLSLRIAAYLLASGDSVAVVDGGNRFNVHAISMFARGRQMDPDSFLRRIYVSRGFTCYQMEQAIVNRLPQFLKRIHSSTAMIFGLLDTFYDEQAPLREVQHILTRILSSLQTMKAEGISVLFACTEMNVLPKERNKLLTDIKSGVDYVYKAQITEGQLQFLPESSVHSSKEKNEKGAAQYGTHRADVHQYHRKRDGKLVEIPEGVAERGPGSF